MYLLTLFKPMTCVLYYEVFHICRITTMWSKMCVRVDRGRSSAGFSIILQEQVVGAGDFNASINLF